MQSGSHDRDDLEATLHVPLLGLKLSLLLGAQKSGPPCKQDFRAPDTQGGAGEAEEEGQYIVPWGWGQQAGSGHDPKAGPEPAESSQMEHKGTSI